MYLTLVQSEEEPVARLGTHWSDVPPPEAAAPGARRTAKSGPVDPKKTEQDRLKAVNAIVMKKTKGDNGSDKYVQVRIACGW